MSSDIFRKYQALFEQSPYGVILLDTEGRILDFNAAAYRDLGYSREEFAHLTIADIDPDESSDDIKASISRVLKEGGAEFEVRHRTKQGEIRNVHVIVKALALSGQTVCHTIWRDITEQKRAEGAIHLQSEIAKNISEGIYLVSVKDLRIVYTNPRMEEMFGYNPGEMTGKHVSIINAPTGEDPVQTALQIEKALKERGVWRGEVLNVRKDGTPFWGHASISLLHHPEYGEVYVSLQTDIDERKKAAEELRESRAVLRQILDTGPQAIFWKNLDGVYLGCNAVFARAVGLEDAEQIKGKTDFDLPWPKTEADAYRADDDDVIRRNKPKRHIIEPLQKADGTRLWIDTTKVPLADATGVPYGVLGVYEDITERKEAEEKIRQSEKRFHALFDTSPLGIVIVGLDRRILDCNVAFQKMIGYSVEELKSLSVPDISYFEDDLATRGHYNDLLEGKIDNFTMEKRHIRKGGTTFWTNLTGTVVRDEKNAPQFFFGIVEDISDRKKMEEDLRSSKDFIESILDTVDEAFIVIDRDYRIILANRAYRDQVGLPDSQIIGKRCHEISHHSSIPCYEAGEECSVRHCFETGDSHSCFHKHTSRDGSVIYVETKAFPLKDGTGAVTSVIETVNNLTDKHLLEKEQLKNQKLEAIGTLAGGIAHDFNNLLQGVFGYISMAKSLHDEKQKSLAMLDQAEKALHMSINLTTQLLTFAKGGKPLTYKISLRPVIENSAKFALSGSRISYRLQVDDELWMVEADKGQIGQVIQNLVLNAEQAMPMGGVITITARNVSSSQKEFPPSLEQGNYVELSIKDSGIGIPKEYLPKIFDPYFTTKDKGSGLGLTTSYSIIKNHGGLIDVTSKLGEGTTFFLYIPAVIDVEKSQDPLPEQVGDQRKARILLMDDEEMIRDITRTMIRSLGHEVEVVEDGKEAIVRYVESMKTGRKFDIVIMDLTVRGGMGGDEAIRELVRIDPDIKAIVSSGYGDSSAMSEFKTAGFRACLPKPYDIDTVNKTLNSLLD